MITWALATFVYAMLVAWVGALVGLYGPELALWAVMAGFLWRDIWPRLIRRLIR